MALLAAGACCLTFVEKGAQTLPRPGLPRHGRHARLARHAKGTGTRDRARLATLRRSTAQLSQDLGPPTMVLLAAITLGAPERPLGVPPWTLQLPQQSWFPRAVLMLIAIVGSANYAMIKVLEENHTEAVVAALRFLIALLPFLPLLPKHSSRQSLVSGVEVGLWCALGYAAQALGLPDTCASKGAFLCSLTVLVVPVINALLGAKVRPQLWGAVALAIAGTACLVGVDAGGAGFGSGEAWCILASLSFGMMLVRLERYAKEPEFDAMGCTLWQLVTQAVAMVGWLLWSAGSLGAAAEAAVGLLTAGPEPLAAVAWLGVVTTSAVLYVETWAMEKVNAAEAGIIFGTEPVWATLFAWLVLGESLGAKECISGAMIMMACLMTQESRDDGDKDPVELTS